MLRKEVRHLEGLLVVLTNAQRQSFETLDELESILWRDRRAKIPQQLDAGPQDIGDRAERLRGLRPDRAVVGLVGLVQQPEALGMRSPVEIAAVNDRPADRRAVAADIF